MYKVIQVATVGLWMCSAHYCQMYSCIYLHIPCLLGSMLRKHQAVVWQGGHSSMGGDHMLGGGSSLGWGNILGQGSRLGGGGMLEKGSRLWGGSRLGLGTIRGWVSWLWGSHNQVGCGKGGRGQGGKRQQTSLWASYWNNQNRVGCSVHCLVIICTMWVHKGTH